MKYIFRIIAALPMLAVGIAAIVSFAAIIELHWSFVFLTLALLSGFAVLSSYYEYTVRDITGFMKQMCNKTY